MLAAAGIPFENVCLETFDQFKELRGDGAAAGANGITYQTAPKNSHIDMHPGIFGSGGLGARVLCR